MFYFPSVSPLIKHVQLAFEQVRFVLRISLNAPLDDAFPSRGRVMAKMTVMTHQTKTNIAVVSNLTSLLRHGELHFRLSFNTGIFILHFSMSSHHGEDKPASGCRNSFHRLKGFLNRP